MPVHFQRRYYSTYCVSPISDKERCISYSLFFLSYKHLYPSGHRFWAEIVKSTVSRDILCGRLREGCQWALTTALATSKNTRLFDVLDQNKTQFSLTRHSVQTARQTLSRQAIGFSSFTGAGDLVLQLICLESLGSELQGSCSL